MSFDERQNARVWEKKRGRGDAPLAVISYSLGNCLQSFCSEGKEGRKEGEEDGELELNERRRQSDEDVRELQALLHLLPLLQ